MKSNEITELKASAYELVKKIDGIQVQTNEIIKRNNAAINSYNQQLALTEQRISMLEEQQKTEGAKAEVIAEDNHVPLDPMAAAEEKQ